MTTGREREQRSQRVYTPISEIADSTIIEGRSSRVINLPGLGDLGIIFGRPDVTLNLASAQKLLPSYDAVEGRSALNSSTIGIDLKLIADFARFCALDGITLVVKEGRAERPETNVTVAGTDLRRGTITAAGVQVAEAELAEIQTAPSNPNAIHAQRYGHATITIYSEDFSDYVRGVAEASKSNIWNPQVWSNALTLQLISAMARGGGEFLKEMTARDKQGLLLAEALAVGFPSIGELANLLDYVGNSIAGKHAEIPLPGILPLIMSYLLPQVFVLGMTLLKAGVRFPVRLSELGAAGPEYIRRLLLGSLSTIRDHKTVGIKFSNRFLPLVTPIN